MDGQSSARLDTVFDKLNSGEEFRTLSTPEPALKVAATTKLTVAQVDMLLDKLCSDDAFRARLLSDPVSALNQIGAPVQLAECFRMCEKLAEPETLKASRAAIQRQLGMTLSANIHDLRAD